jgi:RNA polymerase sigma-70 factor (ECF subfamily)
VAADAVVKTLREGVPASDFGPLDLAEAREEAEAVRRAIQHLPDEQRETLILRHYHGLSYEEIAETLQVPLGTVKWRIHEAVRRLEASFAGARREGA